jgi:hypothetical protein
MRYPLAYCTNVHPGPDLAQCLANLQTHALAVKRRFSPSAPMGVGLWLSARGAAEALDEGRLAEVRGWLADNGLVPFTFNGFPHGDFHQPVVKHAVYLPCWWDEERVTYTERLIDIQHAILPEGMEGSISTLPIAWGSPYPAEAQLAQAGRHLAGLAARMHQLEERTGRLIHLCLEPEPGCVLDHAEDVVRFFERHLLPRGEEEVLRRHLRVCHDVCHSAVMHEEQAEALEAYRRAGIRVGKVQVSSAVRADGSDEALAQLASFNEPRYLHQTTVRHADGRLTFHEDLSGALAGPRGVEYRVHFHVPVFLEKFGCLEAMGPEVRAFLAALRPGECEHFEVETYAWGALPVEMRAPDLAAGIAREMAWLSGLLASGGPPGPRKGIPSEV